MSMTNKKSTQEYPDKKGLCGACGGEYIQAVYNYRHQFYDRGCAPVNCPSCDYPFQIQQDFESIIRSNASATIDSSGKIRFNYEELSELVNQKLKEVWPKHDKQK